MKKNLLFIVVLLFCSAFLANAQYVVFDDEVVAEGATIQNANSGCVNTITTDDAFTGTSCIKITFDGFPPATANWCMMYISASPGADLSEFTDGYVNFAMKTTSTNSFNIRITDGVNKPKIDFIDGADPYDFVRDGEWHTVSIPVADMIALAPDLMMDAITDKFVWRSGAMDGSGWDAVTPCDFFIDDITISTEPFEIVGAKNIAVSTVKVFPIPATNMITVNGVSSLKADILSITGQLVKSVNQANNQLNVSDLAKGVYFLSGNAEGKPFVTRFVKN
jgi:hypothetical protein